MSDRAALISVLILAAGRSTRFRSQKPKVLHDLAGRTLLERVLNAAQALTPKEIVVVVSGEDHQVAEWLHQYDPRVRIAIQKQPRGTGDAVKAGFAALEGHTQEESQVIVLSGDVPFVSGDSLKRLVADSKKEKAAVGLLGLRVKNPTGYGRLLFREKDNAQWVDGIVEEKDATEKQRALSDINTGMYCFRAGFLKSALPQLKNQNAQKEFYLTDLIAMSWNTSNQEVQGCGTIRVLLQDEREAMGINDREQLSAATRHRQMEVIRRWMKEGVTFEMPDSVWIDEEVTLSRDCVIGPNCKLLGKTSLAEGVIVEGNAFMKDSTLGKNTKILWGSVLDEARVGEDCRIGPYARLRPHSVLSNQVKIGNFVEVKKSTLGARTKASHLSYIGDATVGADVNIGCGFVTCNYDGVQKHQTVIEDGVFIGSDSQTVAPVTLHRGAYVASGTTVTHDVPSGALALSRVKQINKEGAVARLLKKFKK